MKDPVIFLLIWIWVGMMSLVLKEFIMYHIKYKHEYMKNGYDVYLSIIFQFLLSTVGGFASFIIIAIIVGVEIDFNDVKLFKLTRKKNGNNI